MATSEEFLPDVDRVTQKTGFRTAHGGFYDGEPDEDGFKRGELHDYFVELGPSLKKEYIAKKMITTARASHGLYTEEESPSSRILPTSLSGLRKDYPGQISYKCRPLYVEGKELNYGFVKQPSFPVEDPLATEHKAPKSIPPPGVSIRGDMLCDGQAVSNLSSSGAFNVMILEKGLSRIETYQPDISGFAGIAALAKSFCHQMSHLRGSNHWGRLSDTEGVAFEKQLFRNILFTATSPGYRVLRKELINQAQKRGHHHDNLCKWDWFAPIQLQVVMNMISQKEKLPRFRVALVITRFEAKNRYEADEERAVAEQLGKIQFDREGRYFVYADTTTLGFN